MDKRIKERRDRLVVLTFVGILLILVYGPGAQWFLAADRVLYDQIARHVQNRPLDNSAIVTINPANKSPDEIAELYGALIGKFKEARVRRIIIAQGPQLDSKAELPDWAATLDRGVPVFTRRGLRLAEVSTRSGFLAPTPDSDGVLRQLSLWQFESGVMFPSLPLAIALNNPNSDANFRVADGDDAVYLSSYTPLPRYSGEDVLRDDFSLAALAGQTVFLDAELPLVAAVSNLPSGQYVTHSEITAALLANLEQSEQITSPGWVSALEWLVPALLGIIGILFGPGRSRREILLTAVAIVAALVMLEALLLNFGRIRFDLGRPVLILAGAAAMSWWLAGVLKKQTVDAFKRGLDFLSAGRLEPAFAEFRQCERTETVAAALYKLSLAFEGQAKPERAEAVLQWLKEVQSPEKDKKRALGDGNGTPERLGRYVIERKLGRGAMGAVYLARDPRINRPVALKVIPIEKEFEDEELEEARMRFFREAELAGRLAHPNIVTVFDAGEDKHLAYIAMEYLSGVPLKNYTDPKKLLAPKKALELCARTADALDYAHNQGVIHRDIKPANLLYDLKSDLLKISDFGVARLTDNNRTKTGIVLGTPMYMSPEQLAAETLTGHSDLFSLGVTLYELLAGEVPFKAKNIAMLMTKITSEDPIPVSNRRPGVPPSVDAVLSKALAKRAEKRFANGAEMAIALRNCATYASA